MHNGKEKMCKFFVAHNGSPTVLGMQDIDKIGLLSINYNSKNRQMAEKDNKNNCKSPRQTEGSKLEQFEGEEHTAEEQNTQDANYINPMVLGNNNKESITEDNSGSDSFSEVLISKILIADTETKDDMTTTDIQINCNSIDFLAESLLHHSSFIIEEEENDTAAKIT